ncbi:MAG: acetate--CoA ligase family protein, partial [Tannerellaceae bacterium]
GPACPEVVDILAKEKNVKAFIVISAGFGEETHEGGILEDRMLESVNEAGASLIGPNCIGLMNTNFHGVFTQPIPEFHSDGVDFISSSGGTALFIIESALTKGLRFSSVWSVGNSKQIGVEDILEYMDRHFDPVLDSKIKMLYIESIREPDKLLYHASSLIRKGCRIAAIKAGSTDSGKRAASSHTGAIASSDSAVEALFRKAGIVRCFSREELTTVASIFTLKEVKGKNCAIVTHAGGPAVMLADALSKGRLNVPNLDGELANELKLRLYPGAAVGNPIDIIGTGTPEHLATAIDFCENKFDNIDVIMVIFGSPGLVKLYDTYEVLHKKMEECNKPIFPVLPSIVTAGPEVKSFVKKGHVNFSDEVTLGTALSRVINTPKPASTDIQLYGVNVPEVRRIIDQLPSSGYLNPQQVRTLLSAANIPLVQEFASANKEELLDFAHKVKYPVVAKVVGPVHKSDIGGVALNVRCEEHLLFEYERMMRLPDVTAILIQPMLKGQELFVGAKYEDLFGHVVLCGLGGIFVEVLQDVSYGLAPLSYDETFSMIRSLRGYPIIKGTRGQKGIDEQQYADIIVRLSTLLRFASEIKEMDINPLVATDRGLFAVDARIRIEK